MTNKEIIEFLTEKVETLEFEKTALKAERDALRESVERTKTDAERYRWLKVNAGFGIRQNQVTELSVMLYALPNHMGELDAAIDAAMKGTQ